MRDLRPSIRSTYDSRETGPRYHVSTIVNGRQSTFRRPIDDPFVRATVRVGLWDILRGLLRGRVVVEVIVGADAELMNDVLELDENQLIFGRTRREAFQQSMHQKLRVAGEGDGER